MKRTLATALAVAAVFAVALNAQEKPAASMWDDGVGKEVLAMTEKAFFGVVDQMSVEPLKPFLASDLVAYDIDIAGNPVKINSRDEAIKYFETVFAEFKKLGATAKIQKRSLTCRATSAMAICLFEYDFVAVMPDGATMTQPTQSTIVLNKTAEGWKWTHWHSALSAPVPTASASGK